MEKQQVKYMEPIADIFSLMAFDIGMAVIFPPYTLNLKIISTCYHLIGHTEKMLNNFWKIQTNWNMHRSANKDYNKFRDKILNFVKNINKIWKLSCKSKQNKVKIVKNKKKRRKRKTKNSILIRIRNCQKNKVEKSMKKNDSISFSIFLSSLLIFSIIISLLLCFFLLKAWKN